MRAAAPTCSCAWCPRKILSLDQALEFLREDECVEVTPESIRLRKAVLDKVGRVKAGRRARTSLTTGPRRTVPATRPYPSGGHRMSTNVPDALKDFRSLWWLFVLFGLLTLAAGIILIAWPGPSLVTIAVIIGIFLLVDGVIDVILSIVGKGEGRGLVAVLGVLSIIAGLIMVKHPFSALAVLVIIVGIWFIVAGVVRFIAAFSDRDGRGTNIVVGILDVVAGIVVLAVAGPQPQDARRPRGDRLRHPRHRVHLGRPAGPQAPEGAGRRAVAPAVA